MWAKKLEQLVLVCNHRFKNNWKQRIAFIAIGFFLVLS